MNEQLRDRRRKMRYARRKKQQSTSIYFLLWATFTALSLFIVLLISISQGVLFSQTYRSEAALEMRNKGQQIQRLITSEPPAEYEGNLRI